MTARAWSLRVAIVSALSAIAAHAASAPPKSLPIYHPDHYEFSASLAAPLHADASGRHVLDLYFDYPGAGDSTLAAWQVDVEDAKGASLRRWIGEAPMPKQHGRYTLRWDGRDAAGRALRPGFYTVRLRAVPTVHGTADAGAALYDRVHTAFALFGSEQENQHRDVMIGRLAKPAMPVFRALPRGAQAGKGGARTQSVPAAGSLPYTVYLGNLHSQTNHSDGGGPLATCKGAQNPQSAALGPTDAYTMMQSQAHGDFLMTSEHNHMFDGSNSTNASANPATAKALFASGLSAAANYNAAHPGFLALYGVEWGVISNGGHLNIFNADGLPEWEYNSSDQLIGDYFTAKSDYPAIYATMKQHGWIGMFNHPATTGQFLVGGTPLGYDANGDAVMVLAEVMNAAAFSANTTYSEPELDMYQDAYNILLERGYHVAPSTDQDNHCANWGLSSTNATGVLLPNGAPLNTANFLDALRARRVFATEDRTSQIVLTANGQLMGQTIANSGPLTLAANYASTGGQTAARVQFFEGVPGRNGTVTQLYEGSGTTTITPANGAHFYYAEITQGDGKLLWSAPVWVNQGGSGGGDSTPPAVTASESGNSGTITLSASASDNVGVARVEFWIDSALAGTDATSPYSMTLDSTTLANGSHALVAKAYDAAGNVGSSTTVNFSVSNTTGGGAFHETESNGSIAAANAVARSYASIVGTMGNTTDKDYYALALNAGDTLKIAMTGPSTTNYNLNLFDATGRTLTSSMGSTSTENLTYTSATAQTVYPEVVSASGSSTTQTYTLVPTYTAGSGGGSTELIGNGGFESGNTVWTGSSGVIDNGTSEPAQAGSWKAWLDGYGSTHTDTLTQTLMIPASATSATLGFWLLVDSDETTTTTAYDTLKVQVRKTSGTVLATLHTYSNLDKGSAYVQRTFDLSAYKGQTVQIAFVGTEGSTVATSFLVDDVSVKAP